MVKAYSRARGGSRVQEMVGGGAFVMGGGAETVRVVVIW